MPRPVVVAFPGNGYEKLVRFKVPPRETVPPPWRPPAVLMVIAEDASWALPMVEEPTTEPFALTARSVEESEVIANVVEVAEEVVALPVTINVPLMVELPLVRRPAVKPMVVEVLLPYPTGVNGKMDEREDDEILLLKRVQSEEER